MPAPDAPIRRSRRAFTLLELIVVIVVLGLLAAVGFATYTTVVDRSAEATALAEQESVRRQVVATLAFRDGTTPAEALEAALADHGLAYAGVYAAAPVDLVGANRPSTGPTEVSVASQQTSVAWALKVDAGSGVKCRVAVSGGSESCWPSRGEFSGDSAAQGSAGEVNVVPDLTPVGTAQPPATTTTTTTTPAPVAAAPGAPTSVVAARGNGSLAVSFNPVAADPAVSSYAATCNPAGGGTGVSATGATSPIVVPGLTNGTSYACTVTATSAAGTSTPSTPSPFTTPGTTPGAPTSVAGSPALLTAAISFTAGANGGLVSVTFTATCDSSDGGVTRHQSGSTSPLTVSGLSADRTYTCTVTASNAAGAGPASTPSEPFSTTVAALTSAAWVGGSDAANNSPKWNSGLLDRAKTFGFDPSAQITSNRAPSGSYVLANAFDNYVGTEYRTTLANPTLRVDFGETRRVVVVGVKVWVGAVSGNGTVTAWGSVDGQTWTQLGAQKPFYNSANTVELTGVNNPEKFRYVELRTVASGIKLSELEIYGSLYPN